MDGYHVNEGLGRQGSLRPRKKLSKKLSISENEIKKLGRDLYA